MLYSSDLTKQRKARIEYINYIVQQERLNQGCANRIIAGNPNDASTFSEITAGAFFTSVEQQDAALAVNICSAPVLPTVTSDVFESYGSSGDMTFTGTVTNEGSSSVTAKGLVWNTTGNPTLDDNVETYGTGLGEYTLTYAAYYGNNYARAYATNSSGTSYGAELEGYPETCLAKGTYIKLANGLHKKIEDITYDDLLSVWNFDEAMLDVAKPLWIKKVEVSQQYNLLSFDNGSILKTINQHRIFNVEAGKFTWPMTEDTPIGTTTYTLDGYTKLLDKVVMHEEIEYYNIITEKHMNMFANGILTSSRYNNIYPIVHMKFVKHIVPTFSVGFFDTIPEKYYKGLRLSEQTIPLEDTIKYIANLERIAL